VPENWDSYICNVNGELASIFLNLSLAKTAPDSSRPRLLYVWVKMRSPRPDGLSSQEEADALWKLGDGLTASLEKEHDAVFVGRITTQGRREFYFYVAEAHGHDHAINRPLSSFSSYEFETGTKDDPTWGQYLSVLYPPKEELQKIQNRHVLEVLQKKGDRLDEPREVSHWIYFTSEADRLKFSHSMKELGYELLPFSGTDKQEPGVYGLQIRKSDRVDQESIDNAVLEILRFAKAVDGEYDGWETQLVQPLGLLKSFLKRVGLR
jgi:uncharacterized protein (TIGR01619 family)